MLDEELSPHVKELWEELHATDGLTAMSTNLKIFISSVNSSYPRVIPGYFVPFLLSCIVAIVIDNNSLLSSKLFGKLFQFVVGLLDV